MEYSRPSKKIKFDDFHDPSFQRRASDISRSCLSENGYLHGKVFMSWTPNSGSSKLQAIMETQETSDYGAQCTHKFYIVFTGACAPFFTDLALQPRDEISLSLKGAQVEKTDKPLRSCTLEMRLVYAEGVIIMFNKRVSGLDEGKIVDTWILSQKHWFLSPEPEDPQTTEPPTNGAVEITKKGKRRQMKAQREQAKALTSANGTEHSESDTVSQEKKETISTESPAKDTALQESRNMQGGLQTATHKYQPLGEVSFGQEVNMIGIVISAPPTARTHTGEWCANIKIVDSTSPAKVSTNYPEAFGVNIFTKKHPAWLPQPTLGDVLILRRIQIYQVHGHPKGTGYHGRFQWAIYSPEQKKIHQAELSNAQSQGTNMDATTYDWTPVFDVCPSEMEYCVELSEWWRKRESKHEQGIQRIDLAQTPVSSYGIVKRLHRLIKDAGPDIQPNGYFDCTVEVIHGFVNNNEVYSLFVTDYTKNDLVTPSQMDFCSDRLADYILKMEMWDAAAKIGPTMESGTYYLISNARMRLSRGGYVEGKVVQPKFTKLDKENADGIPHLKALLERKERWNNQYGAPLEIEDKLIEDAHEDQFFNCVVEVLHISDNGYGPPSIYVTDYTGHPYLEAWKFEEEWFKGLDGHVAGITLWDCHTAIAKSITPRCYYFIKKLRFRLNTPGDRFEGELRGRERLIQQLNPKQASEELRRLIQRKERFLQRLEMKKTQESNSNGKEDLPTISHNPTCDRSDRRQTPSKPEKRDDIPPTATVQQYTSLKEMTNEELCPKKFLIRARVVDFHPFSLKDCSQKWCARCEKRISDKFKACIECADTKHEYVVFRYQIFLMLEDHTGTTAVVSTYDKSHLFDGLERASFSDNSKAYNSFCDRLSPLLGNLVTVHEFGLRAEELLPETEDHELEIVSWEGPDGKKAFGLFLCK